MLWILALASLAGGGLLALLTGEHFGYWTSGGLFTLVFFGAGLLYCQDSRQLTTLLKPLAAKYQGRLHGATIISYPQLTFVWGGRAYTVTFMPNAGSSALPGPFTLVRVTLPCDTGRHAVVRRSKALIRGAVAAVVPDLQATSGDSAFDDAFRLEGSDQVVLAGLLDDDLRSQLMAAALPALWLDIRNETVTAHMDGLATAGTQIEALIALAEALAERCETALC